MVVGKEVLDELLVELYDLKRRRDEAETEYKAVCKRYLDSVEASHSTVVDGHKVKGTVVHSSTMQLDEQGLLDNLTTQQRQAVTRTVVDHKLLEDAVARGWVSPEVVAKHTTEKPRQPYVKVTVT